MSELKREPVKYIRDILKKDYTIKTECYICGKTSTLESHHLYTVSFLFNTWCSEKRIPKIETEAEILAIRQIFIDENIDKLSPDNLFTLCSAHHKQLHNIYGQIYSNSLVPKIKNWLEVQKKKYGS